MPHVRCVIAVGIFFLAAVCTASEAEFIRQYQAGMKLYDQGRFADATPLLERAIEIGKHSLGTAHPKYALALGNLGIAYRQIGRIEDALAVHQQSLEARKRAFGEKHVEVAFGLNGIARTYFVKGEYARAGEYFEQAIALGEATAGPNSPAVAMFLHNLALVRLRSAQLEEAKRLCLKAMAIREAQAGNSSDLASLLHDLGEVERKLGDYARADVYFNRAQTLWESNLGPDHPLLGLGHYSRGNLFDATGQYQKALQAFERSVAIRRKALGERNPDVAQSLEGFGRAYVGLKDTARAEQYFLASIEAYGASNGEDHPEIIVPLDNLGRLYLQRKDFLRAEKVLQRSLQTGERVHGPEHPEIAFALRNLGAVALAQKQFEQAETLNRRAIAIRTARLGPDHPDVIASLIGLASARQGQKEFGDALELFDRARRLARKHIAETLSAIAFQEQLSFLKSDRNDFDRSLSLAWSARDNAEARRRSAEWLLNGKGVAHEAMAARALEERDISHPARRDVALRLQKIRQERSSTALESPPAGKVAEHRKTLAALEERQEQLERELNSLIGAVSTRAKTWFTTEEAQRLLPADAVYIDFVRFHPREISDPSEDADDSTARYLAWIFLPAGAGEPHLVDLGPAAAIETSITAARTSIAAVADLTADGEETAEKKVRAALQTAVDLVWNPMREKIGSAKQLILSPDGGLWLLPWAALPFDEDRYLVEKYTLRYVVSGRDLRRDTSRINTTNPMLFADPDYDLSRENAQRALRAIYPNENPMPTRNADRFASGESVRRATRLKNTAAEVQSAAPQVERLTASKPLVYTDQFALEALAKRMQRPKLVHFATHGFFLEDQNGSSETAGGKQLENPLLRCGLLLAGCNVRQADEDGVLTGVEIAGLDLRGTDLAVLSACETGVGKVHNGEGVAGLRQAFQLAGAHSVVSTLWQVPDLDSSLIMSEFFVNLADGDSKADSLRRAQVKRITQRREKFGAAHPLFWAAWTLTGN